MTDALGNHTTYVYDADGDMTKERGPDPGGPDGPDHELRLRFDGSPDHRDRPPGHRDGRPI